MMMPCTRLTSRRRSLSEFSVNRLRSSMSSSVTPGTWRAPGSTSRGTATSTTSSGAPSRRSITASMSSRSTCTSVESVAVSSTSTDGEDVGQVAEGDRAPADLGRPGRTARGVRAVRDDDLADTRRSPAPGRGPARPHRRRARAPTGRAARTSSAPRARPRPTRSTARERPIAVSVRARLPTTSAWRNTRDEQLARRALLLGELPRVAHLAEDLALADDHRVEPGGDAEEVRDRAVVVVRVEVLGEVVGLRRRLLGEEVEDVRHRGVELRAARVDLDAVARGEQHDLGEVLAQSRGRGSP